jgi:hypothetical protein
MKVPAMKIKKRFRNQDSLQKCTEGIIFLGEKTAQHPVISPNLQKIAEKKAMILILFTEELLRDRTNSKEGTV